MKKYLMILAAAFLVVSCGNKKATEEVVVEEVEASAVVTSDNAQNSLDYVGTYQGQLPTASGDGMIMTITLGDSTYLQSIAYIGKGGSPFEQKGNYTWNDAGNTITLVGVEAPNQYFVGENFLRALDINGNEIKSELNYTLQKEQK